jgi:hypothetical protein
VLVVVTGSARQPVIETRRRVELLSEGLPRQPYHAAAEDGLTRAAARKLLARVEKAAVDQAVAVTRSARNEFGIEAVGIVGGGRDLPEELDRILTSHALLHAAEGDLYEQALAAAAEACDLPVHLGPARALAVPPAVEELGHTIGPPWQKDHKLAATVALAALGAAG